MADTSSLLKLSDALTRRGAALHIGRVVSWTTHQKLLYEIMSALKRDAPAGYVRVSMEMARDYDKELWRRVAELAAGRIKPTSDGTLPLDALVVQAMAEPRIAMLLMPRQGSRSSGGDGESSKVASMEKQLADLRRQLASQQNRQQHQQPPPPGKFDRPGKGNKKGNGKGDLGPNKRQRANRVKGLEGMPTKTRAGENVCFGYNLGKCSAGHACSKGKHVCGGCESASCRWPTCNARGVQ